MCSEPGGSRFFLLAEDLPENDFSSQVQNSWTFTYICEHLQLMYPIPLWYTLTFSTAFAI